MSCFNGNTSRTLLSYIDTRVGTAASITKTAGLFGKHTEEYGQTLPAVLEPNGMNFWTPQTQDTEMKCISPYYYRDTLMQGFRNSHWIVGGCTQDCRKMTFFEVITYGNHGYQLYGNTIDDIAPIYCILCHERIEDILLATKHTAHY